MGLSTFLLFALFQGCFSPNSEIEAENLPRLSKESFGDLQFDFRELNYDVAAIYSLDTSLAFFDDKNQVLNFFDRQGGILQYQLNFGELEKEGIKEVSSIFIHSADTIFMARLGYFGIYQVSRQGVQVNRWDFDNLLELKGHEAYFTGSYGLGGLDRFGVGIIYSEAYGLIADFHPIVFDEENHFPDHYRMPTLARMTIGDSMVVQPFGTYPHTYRQGEIPHDLFTSYAVNDSLVYINFPSSHDISVYNLNTGMERQVSMKSQFIKERDFKLYSSRNGGEVVDFWKDHNEKPHYVKLLIDPFTGNSYRVAKHKNYAAEIASDFLESNWSISKYDPEFTFLGEAFFEASHYNFMLSFVENDTLFVSKMNPNNEKLVEDVYLIEKILLK